MSDDFKILVGAVFAGFVLIGGGVGGCMYGMPMYNVYHQKMEGEAELAKANFSKQVMVQEAQAKMDAATMLANAEVERAKGVAKANQIIGDSLKNNVTEPYISTKSRSSGLGLAIVDKIVKDHNGWLEFSNKKDGGAKVIVALPKVQFEA